MSRKLKLDIPGRDFRIDVEAFPSPPSMRSWEDVFAPDVTPPLGLVVDIGFGRGEFLIDAARKEPHRVFVGIERSYKRTLKMARRLARFDIANVRLVEAAAERAIVDFFPPESIAAAWINFPDPWPKARHARRRLVQPAFVGDLAARLAPGGVVHLATDDRDYAMQFAEVLAGESRLENVFAPDAFRSEFAGRIRTAYELEWLAQGRSFHYFTYRRTDSSDKLTSSASMDSAEGSP